MIREIEERDIERCLEIYNPYVVHTTVSYETEPLTLQQFRKRVYAVLEKYPFTVWEEDGAILGWCYLSAFNPRSAYDCTADLSIYLGEESRGKGIGSKLYLDMEERARRMGVRNIHGQ